MLKANRVLLWLLYCGAVGAIPLEEFYPYGNAHFDNSLPKDDDVSSQEIFLKTPIKYFDELQNSIFINNNGILSFLTDIPTFFNVQFPLDYPVIAPLYTNVDTRRSGSVFYRESQNPEILDKVAYKIRNLYPNLAAQFSPKSVFIVTWIDVGYFKEGYDKLNTYQVAISSDGEESFVELLYKDGGIQWLQGSGTGIGLPDARAQVGFVSADGRMYSLRGSGTDQIKNLDKWTNSEEPGLFTFRVGQIGPSANVEPPQTIIITDLDIDSNSCTNSATLCHSQAQCNDQEKGFCCICNSGYYGNGKSCLKDGIPLRVSGKVQLSLNGLASHDVDLQAYIVTTDSRSYTALSRVPSELGASLQLLMFFPGVIGWLFAKPISGALNGYQLTGGVFNHSMDIRFQNTNQVVKISQHYLGLDVFDQLKLEAQVHGNVPNLHYGNLSMPDFIQQFSKISTGVLRSQSSHTMKVENSRQEFQVTVDQTITFNEHCSVENVPSKLKIARNYVNYEETEKILRFASTTKISKVSGSDDPCLEGQVTCVANSSCLAEGDTFRCVCNHGFQTLYTNTGSEDYGCVDINECLEGTSTCHANAICINQVGSFSCQCRPGFTGNGHYCSETESPCQRNPALCNEPNSYCIIPGNLSTCACNYGFQKYPYGEGFKCLDVDECQDPNTCHVDAICENTEGSYRCTCNDGFRGDGHNCQWFDQDTCDIVACARGAECIDDPAEGAKCVCQKGFIGDGNVCKPEPVRNCNNCAREAVCQNDRCVCKPGYVGDGLYCALSSPTVLKTCLNDYCWCPPGYNAQDYNSHSLCVRDDSAGKFGYEPPQPPNEDDSKVKFINNPSQPPPPSDKTDLRPCNEVDNCHTEAECVFVASTQSYKCQCNPGLEGDGYECSEIEMSCFEVDICDPHATCIQDPETGREFCRCGSGYEGDGMYCLKRPDCATNDNCGANEACSFNSELNINQCRCLPGYTKIYDICTKDGRTECSTNCHPDADCVVDQTTGTPNCKCRPEFVGDGVYFCNPPSCAEYDNCAPTAACVYNSTYSAYQCQCKPGYEGDGLVCHPAENCATNPSLCHRFATCVSVSQDEYSCQCKPGYTGNGKKCREEYTNTDEFILVNQGMATLRVPYHPTPTDAGFPIQINPDQIAIGLTTDCIESRVYWSDMSAAIKNSAYNGADKEDFITEGIGSAEGLAIDWINRNIYWTDSSKDTINMANLDTREIKVLVSQGLVNPRGIAVHPGRRKIFWSDWNRASPKLEVAQLDGSHREVFVQGPAVQLPNSLAVDWTTDELCWADAGTKSIECIGITNYIRRTVVTNCSYPFGLAITSDKYYWTDWNTQKIESSWKVTETRAEPIDVPLGGSGKLYGIATVQHSCPRL